MPMLLCIAASPFAVSGCTTSNVADGMKTSSVTTTSTRTAAYGYTPQEKECLTRAMFFESNRSSRDGLVAVGSVVMNRLKSGEYGSNVCDVVGAKGQFAPGVLSKPMDSKALPDVTAAAESVLKGERHPKVTKEVMFFHTAGLKFPYKNMYYTAVAGGNAFYEKRSRSRMPDAAPAAPEPQETMLALNEPQDATVELPGVVQQTPLSPAQAPFAVASATPEAQDAGFASAMAFQPSSEQADQIGALILSQNRP